MPRTRRTLLIVVIVLVCGAASLLAVFWNQGRDPEAALALLESYGGLVDLSDQRPVATPARLHIAPLGSKEHPLVPLLAWARSRLPEIRAIDSYTCTMSKHEQVRGALLEPQTMQLKLRHEPFSVYLRFQSPLAVQNREAIFVTGKNDGKLVAHEGGVLRLAGTQKLEPKGVLAMMDNRYPVSEIGILRLTEQLIEIGEQELALGTCRVLYFEGVRVKGRPCTCIETIHDERQAGLRYHRARIYVDEERNFPIRFEAYDWPSAANAPPPLLESYTYYDITWNAGLTDADFDPANAAYDYPGVAKAP